MPTHIHGHVLDLLIARPDDLLLVDHKVVKNLYSDHFMIQGTIDFAKPSRPQITSLSRNYLTLDDHTFTKDLEYAFTDFPYESCLDEQVSFYHHTITNVLDKHCPTNIRIHKFCSHPPWYTDAIRDARREKRRLERIWNRSQNPVDKYLYLQQVHGFSKLIHTEKSRYYKEQLASGDIKTAFKVVNTLLNRTVTALPCTDSMKSLSDRFSNFFMDKIVKIRHNISSSLDPPNSAADTPFTDIPITECNMSYFTPVDCDEIHKTISSAPNKSCGLDPLPTWLLKKNLPIFVPAFVSICNSSLKTGTFPSALKDAIVTPLLKKPTLDKDTLKNYRPISNTAFLSKIIEKAAIHRVNKHMVKNNLLQPFQSAYKSNSSTETALLKVKSDIMSALDNQQAVFLVLLDLSAAFDTIDHSILLNRMSNVFGITGSVQKWFDSYLTDRTCKVKIATDFSDPQVLDFGLPQGSVIGPQAFSFYTHPLADIIKTHDNIKFHCYADDTQLYITCDPRKPNDIDKALSTLTACILDIKKWMAFNMLQLNDSKTEFFVAVSPRLSNKLQDISLKLGNIVIKPSTSVRNLGIEFNRSMNMSTHVTSLCRSLNFHIHNMSKIRMYIDQATCHNAIRALVLSRLDYSNSLLYGITTSDLKRLRCIQNRAAKLVFQAKKYDHASPCLKQLHWLPVHSRIVFKILAIVYKCFTNNAPSYLRDLTIPYKCNKPGLRSSNDDRLLTIPKTRSLSGDKGFYHAGPLIFGITCLITFVMPRH